MSMATDGALIPLSERFEKLFLEYVDAWRAWAPRMRAALAEAKDNTAAHAVAIQRNSCAVPQARMSELESDMQPLAEEIIAAPATSLGGLRAKALVALWEALPVYSGGHGGSLPMKAAMTVFAKSLAGGGGTSFADWVRVLVERSWGSGPQARPAIPLVHLSRPEAQRSAPLSLRLLSIAALQKFRASQRNHAGLNRSASRLALDSRYQRSS